LINPWLEKAYYSPSSNILEIAAMTGRKTANEIKLADLSNLKSCKKTCKFYVKNESPDRISYNKISS